MKIVSKICSILAISLFLGACGQVVEQDKVVLLMEALGSRDSEVVNTSEYTSQVLTATRLPVNMVGKKAFIFQRGIQTYRYTGQASIDSISNEEFCSQVVDGKICGDISIQLYLDAKDPNIKEKLEKFVERYKLYSYSGESGVLAKFVGSSRFRPIVNNIFISLTADKKILELVRGKTQLNEELVSRLNEQFGEYALVFTEGTGFVSNTRLTNESQNKLNDIVVTGVKTQAQKLRNTKVKPLDQKVKQLNNEGREESATIVNNAKKEAQSLLTDADIERRKKIIEQIGPENYSQFEKMQTLTRALIAKNGTPNTQLRMIPSSSKLVLQESSQTSNEVK